MSSPVVSLRVWRVPPARVPSALWRMARDRRRLWRAPGVRFAKLLGTGDGTRFGPRSADLTRWAALVCADGPVGGGNPVFAAWDRIATGWCQLDLRLIGSRGRWSGVDPFGPSTREPSTQELSTRKSSTRKSSTREPSTREPSTREPATGPVVAITRARLRPGRAVRFWRAVPPVAAAVAAAPGLVTTFGIGEAPLGWQGTVSVWDTSEQLVAFAYRNAAHREAIARTTTERWYAEDLFARFSLTSVRGDHTVIGWPG